MEKKHSKSKRRSNNNNNNNNEHELLLLPSLSSSSSSSRDDFSLLTTDKQQRTSTRIQQFERIADFRQDLFSNQTQLFSTSSQKRTRTDDDDQHEQHKRIRSEQVNLNETENEPPRPTTIQRRSVFLCQHLGFNNQHHQHLSFNQLLPTSHSYDSNLSNYFSSSFADPSSILSNSLLAPPPLRTTNFVFDNKQPSCMSATTIHRTGNISPAHSDTSTESTSTCSSDEQQFHLFHYQTTRSNRERENYEQLLDLAAKIADPNRFKQVNLEQFVSYRYKTRTSTDLTACVICMSNFKNGQRIRVLPCQHEYHSNCIARWFTMNSSCPICRRDNFLSN